MSPDTVQPGPSYNRVLLHLPHLACLSTAFNSHLCQHFCKQLTQRSWFSASASPSAGILCAQNHIQLLLLCVCFSYMSVCVSYLRPVLSEVRRGHRIPWNWRKDSCEMSCESWKLTQELPQVLITFPAPNYSFRREEKTEPPAAQGACNSLCSGWLNVCSSCFYLASAGISVHHHVHFCSYFLKYLFSPFILS